MLFSLETLESHCIKDNNLFIYYICSFHQSYSQSGSISFKPTGFSSESSQSRIILIIDNVKQEIPIYNSSTFKIDFPSASIIQIQSETELSAEFEEISIQLGEKCNQDLENSFFIPKVHHLFEDSEYNGSDARFTQKISLICASRADAEIPIIIYCPKNEYTFYRDETTAYSYYMSNTTDTNPKFAGIILRDVRNLIFDGNGSQFLYHGEMSAIILDHCQNVIIQGIFIDWKRPFSSEARVKAVTRRYIDLEIDEKQFPFVVKRGALKFLEDSDHQDLAERWWGVMEFESENRTIPINTGDNTLGFGWMMYFAKRKAENQVRIYRHFRNPPKVGNYLILRHNKRTHAGIFIIDSHSILLKSINLYTTTGLGILAQYSSDLWYDFVRVVPNRALRHFLSGHDDGVHFSNCKGAILVSNCEFEGLMDDPVNVHGTSVQVTEIIDGNHVKARFMHHQSEGLKFGDVGDLVGLIDHETMHTENFHHLKSIEYLNTQDFILGFEEQLPTTIRLSNALENLTWTPSVHLVKNQFLCCRARGVLVSTPKEVIIEHNIFHSSGSAILIAGDANNWFESGAVRNVIIRNNEFMEFCMANKYQFCEAIISIFPEVPRKVLSLPFHENITISENIFHPFDFPVLFACSTSELSFSSNIIKKSNCYLPYHPRKATFSFESCKNVHIVNNDIEKEVLGQNIWLINTPESELTVESSSRLEIEIKNEKIVPNIRIPRFIQYFLRKLGF